MNKIVSSLVFISTFVIAMLSIENAFAKTADPEPFVLGNVTYSSHANVITATDNKSSKPLWETKVYPTVKPAKINPAIEEDVQWNVITQITSKKNVLQITDSKGKTYRLDRRNGKLLK